jgi:hypothetical protein
MRGRDCDRLCIEKILARCLKSKQLKSEAIEAHSIKVDNVCAQALSSDRVCAREINASERICAPLFSSPSVCAESLNATNICSNGLVKANAFQQCGKYRATMAFAANTPYVLGTSMDFDVILDDPNGDISLSPSFYTAPLSGYYVVMLQIDENNLDGIEPILGVPIGNLEVLVNGKTFRENFAPFLTFHNEQKSTVSALISLKAGDQVSARYNVFVMTDATGFSPYVGTVQILGTGSEAQGTIFKIHYLSSDCTELPCVPCTSTCTPVPCDISCHDVECCEMECCDRD